MTIFSAALALASFLSPFTAPVDATTPDAQNDTRVYFTIQNSSQVSRNVLLDGRSYPVLPFENITVKAPIGTAVFTNFGGKQTGAPLLRVTPTISNQTVYLH